MIKRCIKMSSQGDERGSGGSRIGAGEEMRQGCARAGGWCSPDPTGSSRVSHTSELSRPGMLGFHNLAQRVFGQGLPRLGNLWLFMTTGRAAPIAWGQPSKKKKGSQVLGVKSKPKWGVCRWSGKNGREGLERIRVECLPTLLSNRANWIID